MATALHWIDGRWVDSDRHADSVDPSNGRVIARYAIGGADEAEQAIAAARTAFRRSAWRHDRALRSRVLNALADRFEARAGELAEAISLENGKVLPHAQLEVGIVPATLRFNAALALTDHGRAADTAPGRLSLVVREPAGPVGIIAPWNSPAALMVRSLAPALAAGATCIVSLPHQTAQVNSLMAAIMAEVEELPRGVVNVVTGGAESGRRLVSSPEVPVISFTGSTATGRAIAAEAAARVKRVGLELGGKTPIVVFDDADLDAVVPKVIEALTVFSGQFCMTGSRLLVQRGIADRLRADLRVRLDAVKVGPASEPSSEMGPLIDTANVERVDALVEDAIGAGAIALVRGGPISSGPLSVGAFYRPTLLEIVDRAADIVQNEIFGPVLTLQVFDTEEEAIDLANDTEFGLSASVWSRDVDKPLRAALAIDAGTIWINDWAMLSDQFEEGGYKQSGLGRARGLAAIEEFLEHKHIALNPRLAARALASEAA